MPLTRISVQEIDRYKQSKVREGVLSAESINKTLTLLATVLEQAVEYDLIDRDPFGATAEARKRRRLRTSKPRRSYLDGARQIAALLNAAGELDARAAKGHPGHRHIRRRAMLATLTFAGLRLGEMLALRWRDVDLGAGGREGRLRIADAKTDAGVRDVPLLPALRAELAGLARGLPLTFVFPTSTGRQIGATNLRRRVLAPAIELANARLAEVGEPPLPAVSRLTRCGAPSPACSTRSGRRRSTCRPRWVTPTRSSRWRSTRTRCAATGASGSACGRS